MVGNFSIRNFSAVGKFFSVFLPRERLERNIFSTELYFQSFISTAQTAAQTRMNRFPFIKVWAAVWRAVWAVEKKSRGPCARLASRADPAPDAHRTSHADPKINSEK